MVQVPITNTRAVEVQPLGRERFQYSEARNFVGPAIQRAGQQIGEAAEAMQAIEIDRADIRARELDVQHMQRVGEITRTAREARGLGARPAAEQARTSIDTLNEELLRDEPPLVRRALQSSLTARSVQQVNNLFDYALGEQQGARDASRLARSNSLLEEALDFPLGSAEAQERLDEALIERTELAREQGQGDDQIAATNLALRSEYHASRATAIAREDPMAALSYARDNRAEMTDDAFGNIENGLANEALEQWAEGTLDGVPSEAPDGTPMQGPVEATGGPGTVAATLRASNIPEPVIAGFLGNFDVEGGYSGGSGDGGTAFGIAQWREGRVSNFQRIIGKHPSRASHAEQARFVVWEMENPGQAGMRVSERNRILAADTPEEAARLIDQFYERSSGAHRERRVVAARSYARGGTPAAANDGAPPAVPAGDLESRLAAIEDNPAYTYRQRQALRTVARRRDAESRQLRAQQWDELDRAAAGRVAELGEEFTSMSQLGDTSGMNPQDVLRYRNMADENRERRERQPASPELEAYISYTRLANPRYFASDRFLQDVAGRGAPPERLRQIGAEQGGILGTRVEVERSNLWGIANPLLQAAGIDYDNLTPGRNDRQDIAERQEDAIRKNAILTNLESMYNIWAGAHPGQTPPDDVIREWVSRSVGQSGTGAATLLAETDDASFVARMNPRDRQIAEQALRAGRLPVTPQSIADYTRRRIALTRRTR